MIEADCALEIAAVEVARENHDNSSHNLLVQRLKDEEGHVIRLEAQLH
jgi:bacterioferritin (cytochrome b1)